MATVLTCYYRPKPGGFCTRLFRAIRALLDRGHTVHYLAVSPFPISHERCVFHRFPWPAAKTDTLLFWGVFYLAAPILLLFIAFRWRVTHAFGFSPVYTFFLKPVCLFKSVNLTCFLRGDAMLAHKLNKRLRRLQPLMKLDFWIEGCAIDNVSVVGLQGQLLRTIVTRHPKSCPKRHLVLPNDSHLCDRIPGKPVSRPLRLGLVGILEPMKNQIHALDMMTKFTKEEVRLAIFGDGPDRQKLLTVIRDKELSDRVALKGWVPSDRIWPQLDMLLMPSLHEGMPNAVMEAIAHHVAVLASDIPAHREILPIEHLLSLDFPLQWHSRLRAILTAPETELARLRSQQQLKARAFAFDWDLAMAEIIVHGSS